MERCVEVILPLHLESTLTYALPAALPSPVVGQRVVVPLGANDKGRVGIVASLVDRPSVEGLKAVLRVLDEESKLFTPLQLKLLCWTAQYYCATIGDTLASLVPKNIEWRDEVALRPREVQWVRMGEPQQGVRHTAKRAALLEALSSLEALGQEVMRSELLEKCGASPAVLAALVDRGVVELYLKAERYAPPLLELPQPLTHSEADRRFVAQAYESWSGHANLLLHTDNESGAAALLLDRSLVALREGRDALLLFPDNQSATFFAEQLPAVLRSFAECYTSDLTSRQRCDLWQAMTQPMRQPLLIIGVRGALFLPYRSLGFVAVAQEESFTYKRMDRQPRYHVRSVALMLGRFAEAQVCLYSPTPSIEAYHLAEKGRIGLHAEMSNRRGIDFEQVNLFDLRRKKIMTGLFSPLLLEAINGVVAAGRGALLFHARKGYDRRIVCGADCGWVASCPHCGVVLRSSRRSGLLQCGYCGVMYAMPVRCPDCGSSEVKGVGLGIEKVEEALHQAAPALRILRIDADTHGGEASLSEAIKAFERDEYDLLLATQQILHRKRIDRVGVVGVVQAGALLSSPDFRAFEQCYQLLTRLSHCCLSSGGRFIIQSNEYKHPLFDAIAQQDYRRMYLEQCRERAQFHYPPFARLVVLLVRGRLEEQTEQLAVALGEMLGAEYGEHLLGPTPRSMPLQGWRYVYELLLKVPNSADPVALRLRLQQLMKLFYSRHRPDPRYWQVVFDVDPT